MIRRLEKPPFILHLFSQYDNIKLDDCLDHCIYDLRRGAIKIRLYYEPGQEPEYIKMYINHLMNELHDSFPDGIILAEQWDHKRWDKITEYIIKRIGYSDTTAKEFLNHYGFQVFGELNTKSDETVTNQPAKLTQQSEPNKKAEIRKNPEIVYDEPRTSYETPKQEGIVKYVDHSKYDEKPRYADSPTYTEPLRNAEPPRYAEPVRYVEQVRYVEPASYPEPVRYREPVRYVEDDRPVERKRKKVLVCPACGSDDITVQTFQENLGTTTVSNEKFKFKQAGHGCLWWLFIGWWWWIIDLFLWMFLFIPRLLIQIFKRKKYKGKATTVSQSVNSVAYKKMFTCQNCGESWSVDAGQSSTASAISNSKSDIKKLKRNTR